MAKKSRTPAPPRKVQAPQRREHARAQKKAAPSEDRQRLYLYAFAAAGLIGVLVAVIVILSGGSTSSGGPGKVGVQVPSLAKLPGAENGPPPWPPEETKLKERAALLGIPVNNQETLAVHYHAHLDIYDDGKEIPVPDDVGISQQQQAIAALHTHPGETGYIHVEAPQAYPYTLGQFFGIWGVNLSRKCIGGLCSKPIRMWVNGHPFRADPTRLILGDHQEIVLAYGTPPDKIRSGFDFTPVG